MPMRPPRLFPHLLPLLLIPFLVSACDLLGGDEQAKVAAAKDAEGRAVGGGCRHAGRSLEDCYQLNPKAVKAAVFAGWRDMDGYMRENKIDSVPPTDFRARPATVGEEKPAETKPAAEKTKDTKSDARPEAKPAEAHGGAEKPKEPAKAEAKKQT